jgi:hypothetical protein
MGIDIYARWHGQSADEIDGQRQAWLSIGEGGKGYLREAYHGEPYATRYLCAEAFRAADGVRIKAATLRKRLPHTLDLAEERERKVYHADAKAIEEAKQDFRDFVALCERKETETGQPVLIIASY